MTDDFRWIYKALASDPALKSINAKLVRALAARAFKLIRHDIPKGKLEVNYQILEGIEEDDDTLPNLLGINKASNTNDSHPFVLNHVAQKLGFDHWTAADKIIKKIRAEKGVDLRETDNHYHCKIKSGMKGTIHKWSHTAITLFEAVRDGKSYQISL